MTARLKRAFLYASKWIGLFRLAPLWTKGGLHILCYHAFEIEDEALFWPSMFMRRTTFRRRLETLVAQRIPVLPLETGLTRLRDGTLPPRATVITIDDGLYSVLSVGAPELKRHGFPATLYATTYYSIKETPVFALVVQYLFWRSRREQLDLGGLSVGDGGVVNLRDQVERERVMGRLIDDGEALDGEQMREALSRELARRLDVDYEHIRESRCLSLMTCSELRAVAASGIDIQLHTHRHRFPKDDPAGNSREIRDNKAVLEPLLGRSLNHFCYPSGVWEPDMWPVLQSAGVRSATTCVPGLNYADTPPLALRRFLDGEHLGQIEFEAEICGYMEMLRRARDAVRRVFASVPQPASAATRTTRNGA